MLSLKQQQDVCLIFDGKSDTCRYARMEGNDRWVCVKHKKAEKERVDEKIENILEDCMDKGIDPRSLGIPFGDNCPGFPLLKYIEQGYDKK